MAGTVAHKPLSKRTVFRVTVARSAEQGAEAVDRVAVVGALAGGLAARGGRDLRLADRREALGLGGGAIVVVKEDGCQRLPHVPFEVIGEQAQEDVGADAILVPVEDGPHFEVDGLAAAEGAFDRREGLIGAHRGLGVEFGLRYRCAQHGDAVEPGFGLVRGVVAGEGEITVGDGAGEVLGPFPCG